MYKLSKNEKGFGALETLLVIVIVVIIGFVGWYAWKNNNKLNNANDQSLPNIISRNSNPNDSHDGAYTIHISVSSATLLINDINALQPFPTGIFNCPADFGITYEFKFTNPQLNATADPTGCQHVTTNGHNYLTTDKFWNDLTTTTKHTLT